MCGAAAATDGSRRGILWSQRRVAYWGTLKTTVPWSAPTYHSKLCAETAQGDVSVTSQSCAPMQAGRHESLRFKPGSNWKSAAAQPCPLLSSSARGCRCLVKAWRADQSSGGRMQTPCAIPVACPHTNGQSPPSHLRPAVSLVRPRQNTCQQLEQLDTGYRLSLRCLSLVLSTPPAPPNIKTSHSPCVRPILAGLRSRALRIGCASRRALTLHLALLQHKLAKPYIRGRLRGTLLRTLKHRATASLPKQRFPESKPAGRIACAVGS